MDISRVLSGGPWSFDDFTLVLSQVQADEIPTQIPLFHVATWVQIHEVPIGFMSQTWHAPREFYWGILEV